VDIDPAVMTVERFTTKLAETGVWCIPFGPARVRFVTHLDASADDCNLAIAAVTRLMS
jgi:threonine aldolase